MCDCCDVGTDNGCSKAKVFELLSRGLSCSLELLRLKSLLDQVFLAGGGEEECYVQWITKP